MKGKRYTTEAKIRILREVDGDDGDDDKQLDECKSRNNALLNPKREGIWRDKHMA